MQIDFIFQQCYAQKQGLKEKGKKKKVDTCRSTAGHFENFGKKKKRPATLCQINLSLNSDFLTYLIGLILYF